MNEFIIFKCPYCKLIQYAKKNQKTKTCSKCQKKINLKKVWIRAKTNDIQETVKIIQNIKFKKNFDEKKSKIHSAFD